MLAEEAMDRRSSGGGRAQGLQASSGAAQALITVRRWCKRQQCVQLCLRRVEWTSGRYGAKRKSSDMTLFPKVEIHPHSMWRH